MFMGNRPEVVMEGMIAYVMSHWMEMLAVVTSFVGSFALLAALTPNKSDDKVMQMVLDWINFFGANVGNAANKK